MSKNGLSDERLRTMQIIAAALKIGVLSFAGFVLFNVSGKEAGDPMLAYIGVGFATIAVVLQAVVPVVMERMAMAELKNGQAAQSEDTTEPEDATEQLVVMYQTKMIIGMAILEGAAFFNLVAYMTSVQWWSLAIVGMLLLAMAVKFPTRFKVESWIETKHHELEMGQ